MTDIRQHAWQFGEILLRERLPLEVSGKYTNRNHKGSCRHTVSPESEYTAAPKCGVSYGLLDSFSSSPVS